MTTLDDLKAYIGEATSTHDALLSVMVDQAVELVDHYCGHATVPEAVKQQATVVVAADLWNRRSAPNGIVNPQFAGLEGGEPIRIARDPMRAAYPVLRRWVLPWAENES